jgi:hypothetical protein
MGTDFEGRFHRTKGNPHRDFEIHERYTTDPDIPRDDVYQRHPNRNINKGETVRVEPKKEFTGDDISKTKPEELVGIIPKELFTYLSTYRSGICVSIIMSTHKAGVEVNQHVDQKAFKTALLQVEKILVQRNTDPSLIKKVLRPGYGLVNDEAAWLNMHNGLAVYIAGDFMKFLRLPGTVNQEVVVNGSFSVMQLVPFMVRPEYFYLLDLNKRNCRFFRADYFGIEYIPVEEMPNAVDDVVHFENKDDQKLFRLSSNGAKAANYHGIGSGKPDDKENIALYLEEVDDTLWQTHLHATNVPLLLAGLEYQVPIYRSVSKYNNIWPEALIGNHQFDEPETIYKKAMQVMKPYFDQRMKHALEEFGNKSATNLASTKNAEIIPAAHYSRISHLFVQKDAHVWGTFNEENGELRLTETEKENTENLADRAVAKTIETGGSVFILDKQEMPGTGVMAAVFRYQSTK